MTNEESKKQDIRNEESEVKYKKYYKAERQKLASFFSNNTNHQILIFFALVAFILYFISMISFGIEDRKAKIVTPIDIPTEETVPSDNDSFASSSNTTNRSNSSCNVQGINLHGDIITYIPNTDYNDAGNLIEDEISSENVYFAVKDAETRDNVKAIIVEIDSSGGLPVAAEEIEKVLKSSSKPVIAYIRSIGASAAYWSATGASRIFASPSSQVGSIAVNASYLDNVKSNEQDGFNFNDLTTGKYKNTMNSNKALTDEERKLIMRDLLMTHDLFVKTVSENRKLDINKVKELANGWAYNGSEALSMGLVDELGGLDEVKNYLKINVLNGEEANVCW